ncbi:hypothetical protein [Pseudalkalibacillus caeni]|nr:hypothetical protein [Pseudalkalibacillus caeni]
MKVVTKIFKYVLVSNVAIIACLLFLPVFLLTDNVSLISELVDFISSTK